MTGQFDFDSAPHRKRMLPKLSSFLFIALLPAIFFLNHNCSERAHDNPFDPKNPATLGKPAPPEVASFLDSVRLQLPAYGHGDIQFLNIHRRLASESQFSKIASVSPRENVFWDLDAAFDVERFYRLSVSTDAYESPPSDSVRIRPGPTFIWGLDIETGGVLKFTHDGGHEILRTDSFVEPFAFTLDARQQIGVVADLFSPLLFVIDLRSGKLEGDIPAGRGISDIVFNDSDNTLWVLKQDSSLIRKIDFSGETQLEVLNLEAPRDMVLNRRTNALWVAENRAGRVREFDGNGAFVSEKTGFTSIYSIAIFEQSGIVWVADSGAVHFFAAGGMSAVTTLSGFGFAEKVAVDQASGACWVIDAGDDFRNSRLVKISSGGVIEFSILGLDAPRDLAVNDFNGYCFVAESGARRLLQFDGFGGRVSELATQGALIRLVIEDRSD